MPSLQTYVSFVKPGVRVVCAWGMVFVLHVVFVFVQHAQRPTLVHTSTHFLMNAKWR